MKALFNHVILLSLLCCLVFSLHVHALFIPYDGSYRTEMIKYNFEWTRPTINASINPLQGLGGLAFPFNFWLSPSCLINHLFYDNDVSPILIYSVITIELFIAVYWLGSCLRLDNFVKLLAAWLSAIFIMPFILPANSGGLLSFYAISGIIPDAVEGIALVSLILGLIIQLDLSRFRLALGWCVPISLLIVYLIVQFPVHCILSLPLIGLFSLYWLSRQILRFDGFYKMGACLVVLYCPSILPCIFAAGWFIDCPATLFPHDFLPDRPTWVFISILFHGPCHIGWMGSLIFCTGLIGAIVSIVRTRGTLKNVAIFYIVYSTLLVGAGVFFSFVYTKYRVPSALYYEWFIWPIMFLYTSVLLQAGGVFIADKGRLLFRAWSPTAFCEAESWRVYIFHRLRQLRWPIHGSFLGGCGVGLIVAAIGVVIFQASAAAPILLAYPPARTGLIAHLGEKVGLSPGSDWRGCVATLTQAQKPDGTASGTSWPDQWAWDSEIWEETGSEYRSICLWWLNIPTLFQNSSTISPDYYFMMTRLFANPSDAQIRSVLVLTHPNINLLRLFGVRILITDHLLSSDPKLQIMPEMNLPRNLYFYELQESNLTGFSPAKITRCSSAKDTLTEMSGVDFDPFREVITYENIPFELTPASGQKIVWHPNAVNITASAPDMCLLVIPFQYSNCVRIKSNIKSTFKPRLIRIDMALTGVLFSKNLDIVISPHYGPFLNVFGKFRDYLELKHLQL
jgi:hypothetical protein